MSYFLKEEFNHTNKSNYLDLIDENNKRFKDNHYKKTLELWGKNVHSNNKLKHDINDTHIEKLIENFGDKDFINENYLEIGCGEGIDLNYVVNKYNFKSVYAVDIGQNVQKLADRKNFKNVFFSRCDCLNLPFKDNSFDLVYSYGVFHHTKDFKNALLEAKRVLKKNGVLIFYTYKKQENFIKKIGVLAETMLLQIFSKLSYKQTKFFCYMLSPIILFFFSYPAQFLKLVGFKKIYKNIPLGWGIAPNNIINDLTDRLYAPINIRYSRDELIIDLKKLNFSNIDISNVNEGLFCRVMK